MKRLLLAVICSMISCGAFAHGYQKDTVFYRDNNEKCHMEVSYIKGAADKPVIVWFHGGGLTGGNAKTPQTLLKEDYLVFSVSYRLYPSVSVREIIDDAAAAVSWVVKNAGQYGGAAFLIPYFMNKRDRNVLFMDKKKAVLNEEEILIHAGPRQILPFKT